MGSLLLMKHGLPLIVDLYPFSFKIDLVLLDGSLEVNLLLGEAEPDVAQLRL